MSNGISGFIVSLGPFGILVPVLILGVPVAVAGFLWTRKIGRRYVRAALFAYFGLSVAGFFAAPEIQQLAPVLRWSLNGLILVVAGFLFWRAFAAIRRREQVSGSPRGEDASANA